MSISQIVLITGASQGLGYAIIEVAAKRDASSTYILCSRNLDSGKEAKSKLQKQGFKADIEVL